MSGSAGEGRGPARNRRGGVANEQGLRALGEQMGEAPPPPAAGPSGGNGPVANEGGLRALGEQVARPNGRGSGRSVANEAGLLRLGEEIRRHPGGNGRGPDTGGTGAPEPGRPPASAEEILAADGQGTAGATGLYEPLPGDRARHRHARPRSRRRTWVKRGALIAAAALLLVVAAGGGYLYYLTHDLSRIHVRGLQGSLTSGKEAGTENILMVGSTSRCALTVQNPAYGLCSQGVNGVNSDVIMVLHVDPNHHRLALLSIPRDLFVPNARTQGPNKIDAGLFQGVSQVVASIEEDFGIPIQHTVMLNFDQFANVVDALGGINMSFPMSVFDAESGLNVQAATCVHLDGTQALAVVRARHLQYRLPTTVSNNAFYWPHENLSDLARIRRDHEFLRVLAAAAGKKGLGNPITDLDLINSVKADMTFDQGWAVTDMANLALDFHSVSPSKVPQLTLPVSVVSDPNGAGGGLMYKGSSYGDVEFTSEAQDQAVIDKVLGIDPHTDSMTGNPLPQPDSVSVSVVNGSGAADQATTTSAALGALGFHTVGVADQQPVGDVAETVVYYGSRAPTTEAAAEAVVRSMSGAVIMAYNPGQVTDGAQVTVVTGTDFSVNPPAPPPATTAPGGAGTATAPTAAAPASTAPPAGSPQASAVQSPSPSTTALQPWDPRACPAGAVPTAPVANET